MLHLGKILGLINLTPKEFGICLDVCVTHMDATKFFKNRNRDWLMSESVNQKKTKCEEMEFSVEKRIRRKGKLTEIKEDDVCQILEQEVKS